MDLRNGAHSWRIALLAALPSDLLGRVRFLEWRESLPSTNERLLDLPAQRLDGGLAICLTRYQTAGRGRNRKRWRSPPDTGLLLSIARSCPQAPDGSLALALGVSVARALEIVLDERVALKWPNDLMAGTGKLGGLLVESRSQVQGGTRTVAGLGLNLHVTAEQRRAILADGGAAPVGLRELGAGVVPKLPQLASRMIVAMSEALDRHPQEGFGPWVAGWRRRDWLAGRKIEALCGKETYRGRAAGVDSSGALLLEDSDGQRRILSAEIRV